MVVNGGCADAGASTTIPVDWSANGAWDNRMQNPTNSVAVSRTSLDYIAKKDGAATTLAVSENLDATTYVKTDEPSNCIVWAPATGNPAPTINQPAPGTGTGYQYARPSSNHTGGANMTFCDGHTSFVKDTLQNYIYIQLMTPNGAMAAPPGTAFQSPNSYAAANTTTPAGFNPPLYPLDQSMIPSN
jgi:prepilin-type processing-associated H-X9-DG protein